MTFAIALVSLFVLLDMQNLLTLWRRPLPLAPEPIDNYTIVVPLWSSPRYLRNLDYLFRYKNNVLLAVEISVEQMASFADELEQEGWRVARCRVARPSPPTLLRTALTHVKTAYVIRMDGDTSSEDDPGRAAAAAAAAGADLCSVRVLPASRVTLAQRLQGVEYDCSMLGRRLRPWLTSGACMIARTSSLRLIVRRHSRWFTGEDMETGVIARRYRMNIHHVDFRVHTTVPPTFHALYAQRRVWWAGSFRGAWINFDHSLSTPMSLFYTAGLVWLGLVFKIETLSTALSAMPLIVVIYTAVTIVSNWSVRSRWMILYPYYALAQSLLLPAVGFLTYLNISRDHGDRGRYRLPLRQLKLNR